MLEEIDEVGDKNKDDDDQGGGNNDEVGESSGIQFDRWEEGLLLERRLLG